MSELVITVNNNNDLKCYNCQKDIKKLINNINICLSCKSQFYNKFYNDVYINKTYTIDDISKEKKVRKKRSPNIKPMIKKNICFEVDYTMRNGEQIKLNIKKLTKTCNMCNIEKNYTEFYPIRDLNKKYYLIGKCSDCYCKLSNYNYKKFSKYLTDNYNNKNSEKLNIENIITFNKNDNNLICV